MKIKDNKLKIAVVILVSVLLLMKINDMIIISEAKAELLQAKKPSIVEVQKSELVRMESVWGALENKIVTLRETVSELETKKYELEPKIRAKRNELLGKK